MYHSLHRTQRSEKWFLWTFKVWKMPRFEKKKKEEALSFLWGEGGISLLAWFPLPSPFLVVFSSVIKSQRSRVSRAPGKENKMNWKSHWRGQHFCVPRIQLSFSAERNIFTCQPLFSSVLPLWHLAFLTLRFHLHSEWKIPTRQTRKGKQNVAGNGRKLRELCWRIVKKKEGGRFAHNPLLNE